MRLIAWPGAPAVAGVNRGLAERVGNDRFCAPLLEQVIQRPTEAEGVRAAVRGIRRTIGTAKVPKAPATNDRLLAMVASQNSESRKTKQEVESQARAADSDRAPPCAHASARARVETTREFRLGSTI